VRLDSNTFGANNIEDVAFQNPDGSHALYVENTDTASHTFNVDENGQYFTYAMPGKSVPTFTWTPGSGSGGGDTTAPSTPTGLAATNTTSSSTTLNWTSSTDNVGVTGYDVYRNGTQIASTNSTSYTDAGLSASTPRTAAQATAPPSSNGPATRATPINNGNSSRRAAASTKWSPATRRPWDGTSRVARARPATV